MEVGLGAGHIVLDGDPPQGAQPSQFSAHVCCSQTSGWIKMPLGTEVGLGPGDIALTWGFSSPKRDTAPSLFRPCLLWPNGLIDMPLGTEL